MIFARIGNGPCYHHWTEIFAGVANIQPSRVNDGGGEQSQLPSNQQLKY